MRTAPQRIKSMLAFVALISVAAALVPREKMSEDLRNCEYDRNEATKCAEKYGDLDGDRALNATEISILMDHVLTSFAERAFAALYPLSHIMKQCDVAPVDGKITEADFDASIDGCLAHCWKVKLFTVKICQKAKHMNYNPHKL
jgi:hypothetical protein